MVVRYDSAGVLPEGKNQLIFGDLISQNVTVEHHFLLLDDPALNFLCFAEVLNSPEILIHALRSKQGPQDHVAGSLASMVVLPLKNIYSLMQVIKHLVAELAMHGCVSHEEHLCHLVEALVQVVSLLIHLDISSQQVNLQVHVACLTLCPIFLLFLQFLDVLLVYLESLGQLNDGLSHVVAYK